MVQKSHPYGRDRAWEFVFNENIFLIPKRRHSSCSLSLFSLSFSVFLLSSSSFVPLRSLGPKEEEIRKKNPETNESVKRKRENTGIECQISFWI